MSEIALAAARKCVSANLLKKETNAPHKSLICKATRQLLHRGANWLNAVAIMGGIVGESAFTPHIKTLLESWLPVAWVNQLSFFFSFILVTSLFILFADLMPKRIAMVMRKKSP